MVFKCPGQDNRNIKACDSKCLFCGYAIEFFSDEMKVRCPECKNLMSRDKLPSCIDWCKSAKECIGEEKWKQLKGG